MKRSAFVRAVAWLIGFAAHADGMTIVYRNQIDYGFEIQRSSSIANRVSKQLDFEKEFAESPEVEFDGLTAREVSSAPAVSSRTDYVADGTRALGFTWNGDGFFELEFQPPVLAFAATILDFGTCCGATELYVESLEPFWRQTAAFGPDLPRGNQQYFSLISDEPVSRLRFWSNNVSDNDLIIFDKVSYVAVPEPAMMSVPWGVLLIGILRTRRWRSRG